MKRPLLYHLEAKYELQKQRKLSKEARTLLRNFEFAMDQIYEISEKLDNEEVLGFAITLPKNCKKPHKVTAARLNAKNMKTIMATLEHADADEIKVEIRLKRRPRIGSRWSWGNYKRRSERD